MATNLFVPAQVPLIDPTTGLVTEAWRALFNKIGAPQPQIGGGGTVTHTAGDLTLNDLVLGNGGGDIKDSGILVSDVARLSSTNHVFTGTGLHTFAGSIVGNLIGNASTASALLPGRTINGVLFDGTKNITLPVAASMPDGTVAAPGWPFTSELDLGLYKPSDDLVGFAADGVQTATIGIRTISGADTPTVMVPKGGAMGFLLVGGGVGPSLVQITGGTQLAVSNTGLPGDTGGDLWLGTVHVGAACAQSGDVRMLRGDGFGGGEIRFRNQAVSADLRGLSSDLHDAIVVGTNGTALVGGSDVPAAGFVCGPAFHTVTELLTIAAAATSTTTMTIPANAIVLGVSVYVTAAIPTAATFTVTSATPTETWNTVAVSTAHTSTDPGTKPGPVFQVTASAITITPNLTPATNSGQVRVAISYYTVTPPAG